MFDEDYGVQSYFGESGDCDFFGDTSMNGGFASGMGEAGFVSEAFTQDSMGGSFFTEASEFDTMGGEFFTEADNSVGGYSKSNSNERPVTRSIPNATHPSLTKEERHELINRKWKAVDAASDEYDLEGKGAAARKKAAAPYDREIDRSLDQANHTKYGMRKVMRRTDNNKK